MLRGTSYSPKKIQYGCLGYNLSILSVGQCVVQDSAITGQRKKNHLKILAFSKNKNQALKAMKISLDAGQQKKSMFSGQRLTRIHFICNVCHFFCSLQL